MNDKTFNDKNSIIVIARFKESIDWINKLTNFKVLIYEKEKKESEPYNVPINKGNEASAYLKFIVDNYDNLPKHIILIHCHDESWHQSGNIVENLNQHIGKDIDYINLNNEKCFMHNNEPDWRNGPYKDFYNKCLQKAIGNFDLYEDIFENEVGCAQFIIHKDIILQHTKTFYQNLYDWILYSDIEAKLSGYYLEWSWALFWKKCFRNFFIKKYKNEKILYVLQLDNKLNFLFDITNNVNKELNINDYYKIQNYINICIIYNNGSIKNYILNNNYIINKYL